ncbi:MAG: M56 family metallopeptidase [Candidatus Aminicenantes bacterium]|nr:MAG: M56 family metallopeptidase [Candidatus Aminicenantes bacterium]
MNQAVNTCITGLNNIGQGFWDYAAGIFIQVSVLIVLLLIIDFLLRKRVRAVFRYCLWMLLFVKLVLPASFTLPTGIGYWLGDYFPSEVSIAKFVPQTEEAVPVAINIPQGYIFLEPPIMNETEATGVELEPIRWQGLVFSGWLVGMLVLLALLVRRICFVRGLIAQSRPANERLLEMLDECRCQIGIRQYIELRLSGNKLSPAVCGLFKPIILMPAILPKKLSREKLKAVLIHELAHIKRGDGWVNLLQTMLQIVYFYNPLVWIANAMVRRVREQAVDEMVLVTLKPETKNYSNMLIDIAEMAFWRPKFSVRLISVVESKKALERRIKHMLNRPVPKSSKLGCLGLIAIVVIGAILLPMGSNSMAEAANTQKNSRRNSETKTIVPGVRVGDYTFGMSEDDVLKSLGKPKVIFYGEERYTLGNLPRKYYMHFGDVSFLIVDDSVKEITALSPSYKFANGLGVGDSEQKIKEVFGDDFQIEETKWKDFLTYKDKGLMFEINKRDRTVVEINVSPIESSKSYKNTDLVNKIIVPGMRVGDYTFDMSKDDVLETLGKPKRIFFGDRRYTLDNLPRQYFMHFGDVSFHIVNDSVKGITVLSPSYKLPNGLRVGDSEQKIKQAFGDDFKVEETKWKDFLSYKDEGLMFEIHKQDRTVMEINVSPLPGSESYKKAHIPPTSYINEQGRIVDKTDYPFVNDPKVIGGWKSVDFVREINQFNPSEKSWKGDLHLNHLIFEEGGNIPRSKLTWTKGLVLSDDTASKYIIREIDGSAYMFYEWKSGDYTSRYMKPFYYVLKKVLAENLKYKPMYGKKADIPSTSYINEQGRIVDKIDYPFVNDSKVIGTWKSVDFVREMEEFKDSEKQWEHGESRPYLKELIFLPNGKTTKNWRTWTKGLVFHSGDKTASKYTIKKIKGSTFMFFEWKSGDYTIRYRKPAYYVLKKVSSETVHEPMVGEKAHIPPTSTIDEDGRIVDKIDYPFINDSQLIGTWKSVDFVGEMEQFKVGEKQWKGRGGELYLKELIFLPNGRTFKPWLTWTKGLVFHSGDKTASKYTLKNIEGSTYMFYEWKSGDYTIRHRKPSYYVLKKT